MSDQRALEAIRRAADGLLPELAERLRRHGLGEIEIRDGDLRLRVAATPVGAVKPSSPGGTAQAAAAAAPTPAPSRDGVTSPAVGFFVYADGLGPGLAVEAGDTLGSVEMLGVHHEVRAPRSGSIRNLVAESGEAVEYGQVVLELEPPVAEA